MAEMILAIEEFAGRDIGRTPCDGFVVKTNVQEILLGIENGQSCCESWGYFWMNEKPEDFIGAELLGVSITDTALNRQPLIEQNLEGAWNYVMFVNLETSMGLLQFTAYNGHNGYYGHSAIVQSKQLEHEEVL